ncbi:MAG TPA: riboflavin synthase [Gemmatimonadaceae bacterium]|nr:riboflavin synthase [Gemmatimonadaceae bacterium]
MFTGLISHLGEITRVSETASGRVLVIAAPLGDVAVGESISLNGVCLTVVTAAPHEFAVSAVGATLAKTTIGAWRAGHRVNLERALLASDRLGGHIVQGHIDGVARVTAARTVGDAWMIDVALPDGAEGLVVPQGSIALDGVSLTVHSLHSPRSAGVAIIEHTRTHTTLGACKAGDPVNVEFDVIGKYVRQLAGPWSASAVGIS